MDRQLFISRMREARKKKGMDLKTLREAVGISQSAMSHYSTGTTVPPLVHAVKIAEALGVSLDWLCGLSGEIEDQSNTCGHVARLILKAEKVLVAADAGYLRTAGDGSAYLETRNSQLFTFFEKKLKFEEMAKDSSEAAEMYQAWLSGALAKLDNIVLESEKDLEWPF